MSGVEVEPPDCEPAEDGEQQAVSTLSTSVENEEKHLKEQEELLEDLREKLRRASSPGITPAELALFDTSLMEQEGVVLYEGDRSAVAGKVFFSLESIPNHVLFTMEKGNLAILRTDDVFKIIGNGDEQNLGISDLQAMAAVGKEVKQQLASQRNKQEKSHQTPTFVESFEDLPVDVQMQVKSNGISKELAVEHFELLVSVLRFCTKKNFTTPTTKKHVTLNQTDSFVRSVGENAVLPLDNGKKHFRHSALVGKGGFGKVFFAESSEDKCQVAIKKMSHKTPAEQEANFLEIGYLILNSHPSIVKFKKTYLIKEEIWLTMEFMSGGTLSEGIQVHQFDEPSIAFIARELLKALQYLHYKGLIHRDLKCSNVMLTTKGEVKLIDFGLCTDISDGPSTRVCGSPPYMAPEMIRNEAYSFPVDLWSFGITMLELTGQGAPNLGSRMKTLMHVATKGVEFHKKDGWSQELQEMVQLCLQSNPTRRSSADELLDHPLIRKATTRKGMQKIVSTIFLSNALIGSGFL